MHFQYDPSDSELFKAQLNASAKPAENRLLLAVLESAIEDLQKYASAKNGKGRLLYEDAKEWITEKNTDWFLSFDCICERLSLSPDQLRRQLLRSQGKNRKAA